MRDATIPSLAELAAEYLEQAVTAPLAPPSLDATVEPFEVAVLPRMDPRVAWQAATASLPNPVGIPAGWPAAVANPPHVSCVIACLGNYPQLMRDLAAVLEAETLSVDAPGLTLPNELLTWAKSAAHVDEPTTALAAAGVLRLAGLYADARRSFEAWRDRLGQDWSALLGNELAALAWFQGHIADARQQWASLPDSPAVCLNRGLAAWAAGDLADALTQLRQAGELWSETDPWHHLAAVYAGLVSTRLIPNL